MMARTPDLSCSCSRIDVEAQKGIDFLLVEDAFGRGGGRSRLLERAERLPAGLPGRVFRRP